MKGKHDCDLQWPFPATVTVNLLNQLEDRHHHSASISIPPNEADVSGRVEGDRERVLVMVDTSLSLTPILLIILLTTVST